jgi:hypothetical protein
MKLLLFFVLLSGAVIYATMPDDLRGSREPRYLSSWGSYLSDLPQSDKPHETYVAARPPAHPTRQEEAPIAQTAEASGPTETVALPEAGPSTAEESQPAKLAAASADKKVSVKPRLQKVRPAKVAPPAASAGNQIIARHKALAPVQLTGLDAKTSTRGAKRRGLGLFLFGRRHANQQAATLARE